MSACKKNKKKEENPCSDGVDIPIFKNDSNGTDEFSVLKKKFVEDMKRLEQEISNLSQSLKELESKEQQRQKAASQAPPPPPPPPTRCCKPCKPCKPSKQDNDSEWKKINQSPLIEEICGTKVMKLQFDVSQYEPNEITASVCDGTLIVSAVHDKRAAGCSIHNEFKREIALPPNTYASCIKTTLTSDGILLFRIPFCSPNKCCKEK